MTPLQNILATYRTSSMTEREKGTYFEKLILTYLRHEATYADLYSEVWLYGDWAKSQGLDAKDTGIDLVAKTRDTDEYHAIQCKFYAEDHHLTKKDIDSFFTASGQKPFTHRIIVSTVTDWTENLVLMTEFQRYLESGIAGLRSAWIAVASTATILKLVFFSVSSVTLLVLAGVMLARVR